MAATLDLAVVVVLVSCCQDKADFQEDLDLDKADFQEDLDLDKVDYLVNCYQDKADVDVPTVENNLGQLDHFDHHQYHPQG
jgi:hypothetical protein